MSEISLCFNKKDFEYDVYTLVKAFYPDAVIHIFYKEDEEPLSDTPIKMCVEINDDGFVFLCNDGDKTIRASKHLSGETDRTEQKNILKRLIYDTLSSVCKKDLPWGTLTGIRPAKIPMKLLDDGMRPAEIAQYMRQTYYTSAKKTALAIAVANRERELLSQIDLNKGYSLYIGIPFCPSICLYCSFGSHPFEKWGYMADEYLTTLFKELNYISSAMKNKKLCTVYIGGGTPTTLEAGQLERLLKHIQNTFDMSSVIEFTVEAGRPDTITAEKLDALKKYNVNRISINPQSMNQKTLDVIGRKHTVHQVTEAFKAARHAGFDNINMDIITGLPGEGKDEIETTIHAIEELNPDSLTVHSLALKRATRLNLFKDEYAPLSFNNSQEIMDIVDAGAKRMQMEPYYMYRQKNIAGNMENVGYARRGAFGIYNVLIMEEKQTILAAGSGAMSKFVFDDGRIERAENVKDLKNYTERIDEMLNRKEKYIKCS